MKKLLDYTGMMVLVCGAGMGVADAQTDGAEKSAEVKRETRGMSLAAIATGDERFTTLVKAMKAADLADALDQGGPYTVFAPTNEAFEKLPEGALEDLLKAENREKLASILKYHVLSGRVMAKDVKPMMARTANGRTFRVAVEDGAVMVNEAKVIKTDLVGNNGVIHVIDTVLVPPTTEAEEKLGKADESDVDFKTGAEPGAKKGREDSDVDFKTGKEPGAEKGKRDEKVDFKTGDEPGADDEPGVKSKLKTDE